MLSARDLTLFTVSGIIVLDQLASSAAIGASALGWWVVTLVFFAAPYAAITAELGSAWPSQGGFYNWIAMAFGRRWAARATWYYWVQLAIWVPSVAILGASMMSQLFWPELAMDRKIAFAMAFIVSIGVASSLRTEVGKWIPNMGALVKVVILLIIGLSGTRLVLTGEATTDFSLPSMMPSYDSAVNFLPVIVFNLMGFELMASAGGEIRKPSRTIPTAILFSVIIIGALYIFATFGVLAALPAEDIVLDTGVIEALKIMFTAAPGGSLIVTALGVAIVLTLITNMVTWTIGANRSAQAAADQGVLPHIFSYRLPNSSVPVAANAMLVLLSCSVIWIYAIMTVSVEDLFWTLLAFSSILFFIPYIMIFVAFLRLRYTAPERARPYRVPGGKVGALIATALSLFFVAQAMLLFVYVPGSAVDWEYTLSILGGVAVAVWVGECLLGRPDTGETYQDERPGLGLTSV
ncbi:MAG: APC family permease [Pseudomonadota bacterium]